MLQFTSLFTKYEPINALPCCPLREGEQGEAQSVYLNGMRLLDCAEYVVEQSSGVSTLCSYCYEPRIAIQVRKSGNLILLLPDFESSWQPAVFAQGVPFFSSIYEYESLRSVIPEFPPFEAIEVLSKRDCAEIFWFEAPAEVTLLTYRFDSKKYLNTNALEKKEILSLLESLLSAYAQSTEPVLLCPAQPEDVITLILDTPDYYEWKMLCKTDKGYELLLEPGYRVSAL